MGNSNCTNCCQFTNLLNLETKSSISYTEVLACTPQKDINYTEATMSDSSGITLIQSYWRGFMQKKHYQFLKKLSYSSSFFPQMDLFETLGSGQAYQVADHKYTYISGTVYEGQWLGGFRHGFGEAVWPDGSSYKGSWSYGYPFGQGTFMHSDGEVFAGKWINPYSTAKHHSPDGREKNGFGNL